MYQLNNHLEIPASFVEKVAGLIRYNTIIYDFDIDLDTI
jgi:hypothetical protein